MGDLRNPNHNEEDNGRPAAAIALIVDLRLARANKSDKVEEYIAEAEHQDGYGYWDQFKNIDELLEDFDLYCQY